MTKMILHIEGVAVFLFSLYSYSYFQFSWGLFFIFLFAPDIAMIGYLINNKVGAIIYNLIHTYSLSIGIIMYGILASSEMAMAAGLILFAHIGMDRMFGFGLKYYTDFKDTHLNRV